MNKVGFDFKVFIVIVPCLGCYVHTGQVFASFTSLKLSTLLIVNDYIEHMRKTCNYASANMIILKCGNLEKKSTL